MASKTESLLTDADKCPPFLVYYAYHLVAGPRITIPELADLSGLSSRMIVRLARTRSWKNIRLSVIVTFCKACGVDLFDTDELFAKLRQELSKSEPFTDLPANRRKAMIALFNLLAAASKAEKQKV